MLKFKYETVAVAMCIVTGQCKQVCYDVHQRKSNRRARGGIVTILVIVTNSVACSQKSLQVRTKWLNKILLLTENWADCKQDRTQTQCFFVTITEKLNIQEVEREDAVSNVKDSFPNNFPCLKIIPNIAAEIKCVMHLLFIHSLVFSPQAGLAGTRTQAGDRYGSGTLHPGQVLRGRLPLLSPAFRRSHLLRQVPSHPTMRETSSSGRWNSSWARNVPINFV